MWVTTPLPPRPCLTLCAKTVQSLVYGCNWSPTDWCALLPAWPSLCSGGNKYSARCTGQHFASPIVFKNRASALNIRPLLRESKESCAAKEGGSFHVRVMMLSSLQSRGPPAEAARPIPHAACGAHGMLGNVRSLVLQSPAGFSPDRGAAQPGCGRPVPGLPQAGSVPLAVAEAGAERAGQAPRARGSSGLRGCSRSLALHTASPRREAAPLRARAVSTPVQSGSASPVLPWKQGISLSHMTHQR